MMCDEVARPSVSYFRMLVVAERRMHVADVMWRMRMSSM